MSAISKYFGMIAPKTKAVLNPARSALAKHLKEARKRQRAGTGPNVRRALLDHISKNVQGQTEKRVEKRLRRAAAVKIKKATPTVTVSPGINRIGKRLKGGVKPKRFMAAAGGRVRSKRVASALQSRSYTT